MPHPASFLALVVRINGALYSPIAPPGAFRGRFFTKEGGLEGAALRDTPRSERWVATLPTPPNKNLPL